jgi:hypothetical protein
MKTNSVRWSLGILQLFIGMSAVPVGLMMLINPADALPPELLAGSIFPNYLIPGIFLFSVNGVGNLIGAFLTVRQHSLASIMAVGLGAFLMAWIVVQLVTLGPPIHWLQPLYFVFGALELALGWMLDPVRVRQLMRLGNTLPRN